MAEAQPDEMEIDHNQYQGFIAGGITGSERDLLYLRVMLNKTHPKRMSFIDSQHFTGCNRRGNSSTRTTGGWVRRCRSWSNNRQPRQRSWYVGRSSIPRSQNLLIRSDSRTGSLGCHPTCRIQSRQQKW